MRRKLLIAVLIWGMISTMAACTDDNGSEPTSPAPSVPGSIARLSDPPSSVAQREESHAWEQASEPEQDESFPTPTEPPVESSMGAVIGESISSIIEPGPQSGSIQPPEEYGLLPQAATVPTEDAVESGNDLPMPVRSADSAPGDATWIERELLRLINDERTAHGLESLGMEETMQFAARIRAQEALESLSHTRPDGTPYHTAFDEAGFSYAGKWHGENIAIIHAQSGAFDERNAAAVIFRELMESAGHQRNILGESFYQVGVGVYVAREGTRLQIGAAQLFASL